MGPELASVRPEPTAAERAAIVAAWAELWPDESAAEPTSVSTRWRFSGRWWADPPRWR